MPDTRPRTRTRRHALGTLLGRRGWTFEELRATPEIPVHLLEDDLRHLDRGLRRNRGQFAVTPAHFRSRGFPFNKRTPRRCRRPGPCPRCRAVHVGPAKLEVAGD